LPSFAFICLHLPSFAFICLHLPSIVLFVAIRVRCLSLLFVALSPPPFRITTWKQWHTRMTRRERNTIGADQSNDGDLKLNGAQ
jgi:hypothetical protein